MVTKLEWICLPEYVTGLFFCKKFRYIKRSDKFISSSSNLFDFSLESILFISYLGGEYLVYFISWWRISCLFHILVESVLFISYLGEEYLVYFISWWRVSCYFVSWWRSYLFQPSRKDGHRAFVQCAPVVWNALPLSIREASSISQFKTLLKTHLFTAHEDLN